MTFGKNDRIRHPTFGFGTIVDINENGFADVLFDAGGRKRLSLKYARLSLVSLEEEAALIAKSQRFYDETFAPADDPQAHGHRPHLALITEDVTMFINEVLPTALRESSVVRCWADEHLPVIVFPPEEPKAVNVSWPSRYYGVMMLIRVNEQTETYECISAFPWFGDGSLHRILLQGVFPWASRVEGHVTGTIGGLPVTFFDALFARHKAYYVSGKFYRFVLLGIAYACEAEKPEGFVVTDPEVIRILTGAGEGDENALSQMRIETAAEPVFRPVEEGDRGDYHFQGPVRAVTDTGLFGQKVWQVRVTVARSPEDGSDTDLDIYVARKALKGDRQPQAGDELKGTLWLQGHLVSPEEVQ